MNAPQTQGLPWRRLVGLLIALSTGSASALAAPAAPVAGETRTFKGITTLMLERVNGEVTIETRDNPTVEVETTPGGPDSPRLELRQDGNKLTAVMITPASGKKSGSVKSTVSGGNTQISVEGEGNTVITQVGDGLVNTVTQPQGPPPLHLTMRIPKSASVSIRQAKGTYRVGDVQGTLELILSQGNASLGHTGTAFLTIDGAADIQAASVTGDLTANVEGSGSILVNGGQVRHLTGTVSGAGDIRLLAEAETARLAIQGAGDIEVSRLKGEPDVTLQGAGSIRVNGREYDADP